MNGNRDFMNMKNLCNHLVESKVIYSEKVFNTMLKVDRSLYCPSNPYYDHSQYINYNVVISAPHIHGHALEALKDYCKPNSRVLDIGFGSGYLTVALSKLMDDQGLVVGIEHIPQLCEFGINNIKKKEKKLIDDKKIILLQADGRLGCPSYAPFNAIHVGAVAKELPQVFLDQLAPGGRLFIPIGKTDYDQTIWIVDKDLNGKINIQKTWGVCYVPLTSAKEQLTNSSN